MRPIITMLILSSALVATFGVAHAQAPNQEQCTLTPGQSPAIRGIRLGMATDQVLALFTGSSERPEVKSAIAAAVGHPNYGVVGLSFQPIIYPSEVKERFSGIESISITFFDGRVTDIGVGYKGPNSYPRGAEWHNVDDFVAKLSEVFALPGAKEWFQVNAFKSLKCDGFYLEAYAAGGTGSISIRDSPNTYRDKVRQRCSSRRRKNAPRVQAIGR